MSPSSLLQFLLPLALYLTPASALAWDYIPNGGNPLGSLAGGTRGTLSIEHPKEGNNEFVINEKLGKDTIFFDDEENKSSGAIWVKSPLANGQCDWYFYQGATKFQEKYFLGQPSETLKGDCNKP
jgi:hypothetical protein